MIRVHISPGTNPPCTREEADRCCRAEIKRRIWQSPVHAEASLWDCLAINLYMHASHGTKESSANSFKHLGRVKSDHDQRFGSSPATQTVVKCGCAYPREEGHWRFCISNHQSNMCNSPEDPIRYKRHKRGLLQVGITSARCEPDGR